MLGLIGALGAACGCCCWPVWPQEPPAPPEAVTGPPLVQVSAAGLTLHHPETLRALWSNQLTFGERKGKLLAVHRLSEDGTLIRLGEHGLGALQEACVVQGVGKHYGVRTFGPLTEELAVYEAGKLLYRVPRELLRWRGAPIDPQVVLADGALLAEYCIILRGLISPAGAVTHACLISPKGEYLVRPDLAKSLTVEFSGDGSVVGVFYHAGTPAHSQPHTQLYSARDGKPLATLDGFWIGGLSYDGRTAVGTRRSPRNTIAVCKDGLLIAEKPTRMILGNAGVSPDGAWVVAESEAADRLPRVMDSATLTPIYAAPRALLVGTDTAVSSTGRLACRNWRSVLVYDQKGAVVSTCRFPTGEYDVRELEVAWSRDGNTLYCVRGTLQNSLERGRYVADATLCRIAFHGMLLEEKVSGLLEIGGEARARAPGR